MCVRECVTLGSDGELLTPGDEFPHISEQGRGSQLGGLDRHRATAPPGVGGGRGGRVSRLDVSAC